MKESRYTEEVNVFLSTFWDLDPYHTDSFTYQPPDFQMGL